MKAAAAAIVALFALAMLVGDILPHPHLTPDGFIYTWFAVQDTGKDPRSSASIARTAYLHTPLGETPRYRQIFEMRQPALRSYAKVFVNRPLYPRVASFLVPYVGLRALTIVSAVSYFVFALALFWCLSWFGRPWLAAIITVAALALPLTRGLASNDLTDMFAMVWWTLGLGALIRLLDKRSWLLVFVLAVSSVLLALSRPTPYEVVVPAFAIGVLRRYWWPLAASSAGMVAYAVEAITGPNFSLREQFQWEYVHQPGAPPREPFGTWYAESLTRAVRYTIVESIRTIVPMVAVIVGFLGLRTNRRDQIIVLFAALLPCLVAIPLNPIQWSIARVVAFPLIPIFAAIIQCVLCATQPLGTILKRRPQLRSESSENKA